MGANRSTRNSTVSPGATTLGSGREGEPCISVPLSKTREYSWVQVHVPTFFTSQIFAKYSSGLRAVLSPIVRCLTNSALFVQAGVGLDVSVGETVFVGGISVDVDVGISVAVFDGGIVGGCLVMVSMSCVTACWAEGAP